MDRTTHLKRFRGAALFMILVFALAIIGGIVLLYSGDPAEVETGRSIVIGAAMVLILALMSWNGSLIGAGLLALFMLADFALTFDMARILSWPTFRGALYIVLSFWLLRELFMYRRKSRREDETIGGSAFIRWGGTSIVALGSAVVAAGLILPSLEPVPSGVLSARQITGEQYSWMLENEVLGRNERVFYYSEEAGKSYAESGNLLTDRYVGYWQQGDEELETGWIRVGEICRVEKTRTDSDVAENMYMIYTFGEDSWLRLMIAKEDGGDREFVSRMNYLNNEKMHSEVRSACDENREPNWALIAEDNGISPNVVGPDEIDQRHLSWLRHNDFLTRKEKVLKFYSHGRYSIEEGGLLLTDSHFGGWSDDSDGLHYWWYELGEICKVSRKKNATKSRGPLYRVDGVEDDSWFEFHVPEEEGEDGGLIDLIKSMNAEMQSGETAETCAARTFKDEDA